MSTDEGDSSSPQPASEDVDAKFLIGVESKLRAPFSSLDLAKAVSTTALRSSDSPRQYLEMVAKVLPRLKDKAIQLRVLVGLLGLEPSADKNDVVCDILTQAQEAPTHEEWVRVVAGLIRGIMFYNDEDDDDAASCRGEEARSLLENACKDILEQVQTHETDTDKNTEGTPSDASISSTEDLHPLFAPYRYSLLNPNLLQNVIPECQSNPHFQVNKDSDILSVDQKLEDAKAQEEQRENAQKAARTSNNKATTAGAATRPAAPAKTEATQAEKPRPTTTTGRPKPAPAKPSMFLQSKKPAVGTQGRLGRQLASMRKNPMHTRKPGSAQALLSKGRRRQAQADGGGSTTSTTGTAGGGGRAMKYGNSRSKMKMIDISQVQGLTKEHKEREDKLRKEETREQKLSARKRKIMEAAAAKGLVLKSKKSKTEDNGETTSAATASESKGPSSAAETASEGPTSTIAQEKSNSPGAGALQATAAAALLAYQQQVTTGAPANDGKPGMEGPVPQNSSMEQAAGAVVAPSVQAAGNDNMPRPSAPAGVPKQDWRQLLEKSNKLSGEDRFRVRQFFIDRFNPTPDVPVYKMKLHEEKTADPETGQTVKETLYLELDYNTFGFKKLRKIKKK